MFIFEFMFNLDLKLLGLKIRNGFNEEYKRKLDIGFVFYYFRLLLEVGG